MLRTEPARPLPSRVPTSSFALFLTALLTQQIPNLGKELLAGSWCRRLRRRCRGNLLIARGHALQGCNPSDHRKDRAANDQKINDGLHEDADVEGNFGRGCRAIRSWYREQ